MESSIAVFLKRWLACELPPTEAVHGSARTPAPPPALPTLCARPQPHPPPRRGAYRFRRTLPTRCGRECRQGGWPVATVRQTYLASVGRRSSSSLS